jgi:hypothetical protein
MFMKHNGRLEAISIYTSSCTLPLGGSDAISVRGGQTTRRIRELENDVVTPLPSLRSTLPEGGLNLVSRFV